MQEKLTLLETNYSKMEAEYFKKIRNLKNALQERTHRQATLNQQISNLRDQVKIHTEEIASLTEELTIENERIDEPKQFKKNSSPGLLKKSLENERKIDKRMSPTNQPSNNINKSETSLGNDRKIDIKGSWKGFSPTNSSNKITKLFFNHQKAI